MARVGDGLSQNEVKRLLGPPDDVWPPNDSENYVMAGDTAWCYGTNGHHTLPTLGYVMFRDWKVLYAHGGYGEPPSSRIIGEDELVASMRRLYRPRDASLSSQLDTLRLLQSANVLISLGREKALAVLGEYSRVGSDGPWGGDWLFWLVHVAFQSKLPGGVFPVPMIAVDPPKDLRLWPAYPLLLVDDVPFCVPRQINLGGHPEEFGSYLYKHGKEWAIRTAPLRPPDDPFLSYEKLIRSATWQQGRDYGPGWDAGFIEGIDRDTAFGQVIALVRTVYRPVIVSWARSEDFEKDHREFLALGCRWDDSRQMYVRKDGTVPSGVSGKSVSESASKLVSK